MPGRRPPGRSGTLSSTDLMAAPAWWEWANCVSFGGPFSGFRDLSDDSGSETFLAEAQRTQRKPGRTKFTSIPDGWAKIKVRFETRPYRASATIESNSF